MQWGLAKKLSIFFLCTLFLFPEAQAQVTTFRLQQADSLYQARQYTQSLAHYEAILRQNEYTPAMLLRMAYIKEGLGQVGEALYYLNRYYSVTHDPAAPEKMAALAEKNNLEGYDHSEIDRARALYADYRQPIALVLAALAFLCCSLAVYGWRQGRRPFVAASFTCLLVVGLVVQVNYTPETQGIITGSQAYLMKGPSPGASLAGVVRDGHRVAVIGRQDVWYKIYWHGEVAYIKAHHLLPVM